MLQVCRASPKRCERALHTDPQPPHSQTNTPASPQTPQSPQQPRTRAHAKPTPEHAATPRIYAGARPANQPGARPFPPTATRAVASLDEAERLDGVVLFLEGLDVVVDSGAGRVGNLEAVDDLPLATVGGDGEA